MYCPNIIGYAWSANFKPPSIAVMERFLCFAHENAQIESDTTGKRVFVFEIQQGGNYRQIAFCD